MTLPPSKWYPGLKLVCIDDQDIAGKPVKPTGWKEGDPLVPSRANHPQKDEIVTIRDLFVYPFNAGKDTAVGVLLVGYHNIVARWNGLSTPCEAPFGCIRFRPLNEDKITKGMETLCSILNGKKAPTTKDPNVRERELT